MNMDISVLLVFAVAGGLIAGIIASSKNQSFISYFVIGFLLPVIGIIAALVAAPPSKLSQLTPADAVGWHPDPTGRFDNRYFDGRLWTRYVSRQGRQYEDVL